MPRQPLDLSNTQFDSLRAIEDVGVDDLSRARLWLCECSCGEQRVVRASDLKGRRIRSCSAPECIDQLPPLSQPKLSNGMSIQESNVIGLTREVDFKLQRFLDEQAAERRRVRDAEGHLPMRSDYDPDDDDAPTDSDKLAQAPFVPEVVK